MPAPIVNAKDNPNGIQGASLPNVSDAMASYFQTMVFKRIGKTVNQLLQVLETAIPIQVQGVWQPFTPQQLIMKPEKQRAWKWFMLHAAVGTNLQPDDVVQFQGTQYRVMGILDYSLNGYLEYHVVNDYTGSGP